MESGIGMFIKKYPSLTYFDLKQALTSEQLQIISQSGEQSTKSMDREMKEVKKVVRQLAIVAQRKMKEGKKLFKTIQNSNEYLDSIILNNSNLKSIEAFEYRQFNHLTQLQLSSNQIRRLSPLKRSKMPVVESVDLSSNLIETLRPLKEVHWPRIRVLNLNHNNIVSMEGFPLYDFKTIKHINLSDNFLREVRWLRKAVTTEMTALRHLNLSSNEIVDLKWLAECQFYKLQHLNLRNNKYGSFLEIEKLEMSRGEKQANSQYEILVSSMGQWTSYTVGFRSLSRHKHSVRIEAHEPRPSRQNIQKSRKIILY